VTYLIAKVVGMLFGGLRVSEDVEMEGLDVNLHAESAYDFSPVGGGSLRTGGTAAEVSVRTEEGATA
jgi:Amt family ammonium transporter